jgi:PAS domain S-box-containing protein
MVIISKSNKKLYIPTTEFYKQVIDSLKDYSIFTMDNEFKINSWNSASSQIFGYELDEVIGEHFELIFTPEDRTDEIPKKEIDQVLKEGRATDNRWHIKKDGSLFFARGLVFPLVSLEGEMLGFVKILQDLTENKKSDDAIQKYVKELEELHSHKQNVLAILSHDLRSPLTTIIGLTNYLKNNLETMEVEEVHEFLEMINTSTNNELAILDNLLDWARIKFASDVFSPEKLNLTQSIDKVFKILRETAILNEISLQHEVVDDTMVFADAKMLNSILQNLVSNAIKFSTPGGKVTIRSEKKDSRQIIQIKDTGIGISKEGLEKLFSPHVKTLSKARKEKKGAGIGLLLVKGFVSKNGGEVWVESVEGEGSSFYFTLPVETPTNS